MVRVAVCNLLTDLERRPKTPCGSAFLIVGLPCEKKDIGNNRVLTIIIAFHCPTMEAVLLEPA